MISQLTIPVIQFHFGDSLWRGVIEQLRREEGQLLPLVSFHRVRCQHLQHVQLAIILRRRWEVVAMGVLEFGFKVRVIGF